MRNRGHLTPLSPEKIIDWARQQHARTGKWPVSKDGAVIDAPGETWPAVAIALHQGLRGLSGSTTLNRFLARHCGKRDSWNPPRLTIEQILAWADDHRQRTGQWPSSSSGPVTAAPGESWAVIARLLWRGDRGLPGKLSIHRLLVKYRGKRDPYNPPRLSAKQILKWADEHYQRTGDWPSRESGRVLTAPGEGWHCIWRALQRGTRGLPGGMTLPGLFRAHRREAYARRRVPLTRDLILEWVTAHHELTGVTPTVDSGPVIDEAGETWRAIDASLRTGTRRTRDRSSLENFITAHYAEPYPEIGQRLSESKIIGWARAFQQRVGKWPTAQSAYVFPAPAGADRPAAVDRPGERWATIDRALREGRRGLKGGSSLARLLRDTAMPG